MDINVSRELEKLLDDQLREFTEVEKQEILKLLEKKRWEV